MYEFNRSTKPRLRLGGWLCQVLTARLNTFTSGLTWKRGGSKKQGSAVFCEKRIIFILRPKVFFQEGFTKHGAIF